MSNRVFLDTEFSGIGQRWPRLISLALVAEDESVPPLYIETPRESWVDKATSTANRLDLEVFRR